MKPKTGNDRSRPALLLAVLVVWAGLASLSCQPSSGGGGGSADSFTTALDFGSGASFDLDPDVPQIRIVQATLPTSTPRRVVGGDAVVDKSAVRLTKEVGVGRINAQAGADTLDVRIAAILAGGQDACSDGIEIGEFTLTLNAAGDDFTIDPPLRPLNVTLLRLLLSGTLEICVEARANFGGRFAIDRLNLALDDGRRDTQADQVSITLAADGREVGQVGLADPLFYAIVTEPPETSPVAGLPYYLLELGSGQICDVEIADVNGVSIVIEDLSLLDGRPVDAVDWPGYLALRATYDGVQRAGVYCNSDNPDVAAICSSLEPTLPTGTISLRLAGGRLSGSLDLSILAANTLPPGGEIVTLRAVGQINLPMTLVQLPPCLELQMTPEARP